MPVSMTARDRQAGSALIVVAVLLIFAGFVLMLGLGPFHTTDNQDRISRTAKRQQFMIDQLSAYVQRENQLPCPAAPTTNPLTDATFGFSVNAPANDPSNPGTCAGTPEGIVPFRTLGLAQYDALDGWGHPFTYAISPALNNQSSQGANPQIFNMCRLSPWFNNYSSITPNTAYNINPGKAEFCCPPIGYATPDVVVLSSTTVATPINGFARTADPPNYGPMNTMTTNIIPGTNGPPTTPETQEFFAFVIVSHGANAAGSYVLGTNTRLGGTVAGSDEATNAGLGPAPQDFVDHAMVLAPGKNYFDDMVVWRTQIGIMGELNNASCYAPFN